MGIEIMPVAITDRYAVAIRITVQDTDMQRARVRWKMDPILINDKHLIKRISSEWVKWQTQTALSRYNHVVGAVCKKTPSYPHPQRTVRT